MELIKMSERGQLMVPAQIRELLGLHPEDRFVVYGTDDYIIFKKVKLPTIEQAFDELVDKTSSVAQTRGITEQTVIEELKLHRKARRPGE